MGVSVYSAAIEIQQRLNAAVAFDRTAVSRCRASAAKLVKDGGIRRKNETI